MNMNLPTEPVGSLPRPSRLQAAFADYDAGKITHEQLVSEQDAACLDSIRRMEGHRLADRLGRRAAGIELRHLSRDQYPGGHRSGLPTWRRTASTSPSSPTAITASCPGSSTAPSDGDQADEAGGDRALDARPPLPAGR